MKRFGIPLVCAAALALLSGCASYYDDPYYYRAPSAAYGSDAAAYYGSTEWLAYCSQRFRSFDPASGTYLGYDGYRHYCT